MDFGYSKKMLAFCLFSCALHVVVFALLSQPARVPVSKPNIGVSFVDVSIPDFKPLSDFESQNSPEGVGKAKAPVPHPHDKESAPPLIAKKPPAANIVKPTAVAEPVRGEENRAEEPVSVHTSTTIAPEAETIPRADAIATDQVTDKDKEHNQVPVPIPLPDIHGGEQLFSEPLASSEGADLVASDNRGVEDDVDLKAPAPAPEALKLALPLYDVNPKPKYPKIARSRGWEGSVLLEVSVAADGKVEKITLLQSSGYRALDKAARKTVYRWKFKPASIAGVPTACTVKIPINFQLNTIRG